MKASTTTFICGSSNSWKIAEPSDPPTLVQKRDVALEIQGDPKNGYHLIMSPDGCFTADTWHLTLSEAIDTAQRLFDVDPKKWNERV